MDRKVKCPSCHQVQAGLVMIDGRLYAFQDEQIGTRVLSYECAACGRRVHHGERGGVEKLKPHKLKVHVR